MDLTKDTIEHLEKNQAEIVKHAQHVYNQAADIDAVILPENLSIHRLEKYQNKPSRFRGGFIANTVREFLRYCDRHGAQVCFVNPYEFKAKAYFDLGDPDAPDHGTHVAQIELDKTAAWSAITQFAGNNLRQREFVEFIEDWRDNFSAIAPNGEPITNFNQVIAALRTITIEQAKNVTSIERDFGSEKTEMEKIEAKSEQQIPAYLVFSCKPCMELTERAVVLRVSITVTGEYVYIRAKLIKQEELIDDIQQEFRELLVGQLPENTDTFVGVFTKG